MDVDYTKDLNEIRFLRNRVFIVFFLFIPYGFLMHKLSTLLHLDNLFGYTIFGYGIFYIYCGFIMSFKKCPRCKKRFFAKEISGPFFAFHNPFSGKCMNCGLELNAKKEKNAKKN